MPELPTTSVVIPTHGRRALLEDVLAPVLADPATTEVVVVVDGCDDGSIELVEELRRDDERLVARWAENGGPSAARQAGVEAAVGEVVVLLDDDVVAEPGLVAGHARAHADRDGVVVVGYAPVEAPRDSSRETVAVDLYDAWYEECVAGYEARPESVLENYWAGNASLRRADALRVGLHSPVMAPTYNEDRDFGLRCREAGLRATFDRRLRARHRYRRSFAALRRDAHTSGVGRWRIHDAHGDVVGSLPADAFTDGLPPVRAALVGLSRRPRLRRLLRTGLAGAVHATTPRGPRAVRSAAALLDLRIGQQKAAIAASREVREPLPVAVVVPAHNRPAMVRRALESVGRQTARPAEVIVVDDCSTDDTGAVAAELGARVIRHAVNRGEGGARNTGLREATQPWVALLDSDDEWLPHHLETIWPLRAGRVLAAGTCAGLGADGTPQKPYGVPGPRPRVLRSPAGVAFPENCVPPSAAVLHRETALAAGGFDTALKRCADLDLWLRMLERGRGVVSPAITAVYHLHDGQVSADGMAMQAAHAEVLDAYAERRWCTAGLRARFAGLRDWDRARARQAAGDRAGALRALRPALRDPRRAAGIPPALALRRRARTRTAALVAEGVAR